MQISSKYFGLTKTGKKVIEYTMKTSNNYSIKILNYGGIIRELKTPDSGNLFEDIICGYDNIKPYEELEYQAGIICRLDESCSKEVNPFLFNSRILNFNKVIWKVTEKIKKNKTYLIFNYYSKKDQDGFSAPLELEVVYSFDKKDVFKISYKAKSLKTIKINLTTHIYMNLKGNVAYKSDYTYRDIRHQNLYVNIDQNKKGNYIAVNESFIPKYNLITYMKDFPKKVELNIAKIQNFPAIYTNQELYPLTEVPKDYKYLIKLGKLKEDDNYNIQVISSSGRKILITTDQKAVYIDTCHTNNLLFKKASGKDIGKYAAFCIAPQYYPENLESIYELGPNKVYQSYTKYHLIRQKY